ncbi:MAG: polyphosphate polymerase domain-containing protein [Fibrobacteraceae bacterium]|nr:polyphosphate polymerase domain-containing protein [Fibrobacteraceae bacterium]
MSDARGFSLLERFELKYHIPVEMTDDIGRFIAPYCEEDYYSKITPGGFYWITNLYLDSPKWTFLSWRKAQLLDRFNMRVRCYGEHPKQDGTFHFEVKRKLGSVGYKSRATINGENPSFVWENPESKWPCKTDKDRKYLHDFIYKTTAYNARPRLLTQYKRRAWFGLNEEYSRVTIDTDMRFREENGFDYSVDPAYMWSTGLPRFFERNCNAVLELKCPALQVPFWMLDLIRHFNLKHGGFSKFGNAAAEWKRVYENPKDFRDSRLPQFAGDFEDSKEVFR